jgi:hypothetical protein
MALLPCKGCGTPVDSLAKACPKCGRSHPASSNTAELVLGAIVAVGFVVIVQQSMSSARAVAKEAPAAAAQVHDQLAWRVVNDSIQQYEIAARSGTKVDACVHAGLVAAAAIQAKDEDLFRKWKEIERYECGR